MMVVFFNYFYSPNDTTSLYNNDITDITTTNKGINYIISRGGLSTYNYNTKKISIIPKNKNIQNGKGCNYSDKNSHIWMSDYSGVFIYEMGENGQLNLLKKIDEIRQTLTLQISQGHNDDTYVCNENFGFCKINIKTYQITKLPFLYNAITRKKLLTNGIRNLNWQSDTIAWANFANKQMLKINMVKGTFEAINFKKLTQKNTEEVYSNPSILSFGNKTYIAIGAASKGLQIVDAKTLQIVKQYTEHDNPLIKKL